MSVEITVYLHDEDLPTLAAWQRAIDAKGVALKLGDFSLSDAWGFRPTKLNGEDCGFEYSFQPLDPHEGEEVLAEIGDRDRRVDFVWHSSEIDGRVAMLAAAVLTELVDGVFFDPQGGEFARGGEAFSLLAEQERSERDRKMHLAEKKWGSTTTRRCP